MSAGSHVLIIVQNLPVPLDRRVWLESLALEAAGYQVSVVCPKGPGDPEYQVLQGVHIYKYDAPAGAAGVGGYLWEFASCWVKTARLVRRADRRCPIDVIQSCNPPDTYAMLARFYKRRGVKFVYDQHDLCPEVYRSRFAVQDGLLLRALLALEGFTYRTADHVISTNDSYRQKALTRGGVAPDAVTVVRSGPDTRRMRRTEARPELRRGRRHLAVYLGIMGPQDGVDNVLFALRELIDRGRTDLHVALLGFGDCLEELKALSSRLMLDDHVTFTGRADAAMIEQYLSTADLGLCPDPSSPLNDVSTMNKVMEYMAYEVPVVSFDLHESRVSAGSAAVFARDLGEFVTAVELLLDDDERRADMARYGRARAVNDLDWTLQAERYVAVFDLLVAPAIVGTRVPAAREPIDLTVGVIVADPVPQE